MSELCPGLAPASSGGCWSRFGILADSCLLAQVRGRDGAVVDVAMEEFLAAVGRYREAVAALGFAVGFLLGDVEKNLAGVTAAVQEDPAGRGTHRSFLQAELDSGVHKPGEGSVCRLRDPSGACQMQWMLLGMELVLLMLKLLFEGDRNAVANAYSQTLQPYHSWYSSTMVRALVTAVPSKESICAAQELCPGLEDRAKLAAAISRDADRATCVMLPMVRLMINMCQEFGLWECKKV